MNEILKRIYEIGIIPVIAVDRADQAVPLARALVRGGLPAAEITFRTEAAEEAIRQVAQQVPEMLVGAGTVLTTEQADRALAAGAQFIVSPGVNPHVSRYVVEKGALMLPGTATPGEMEQAMELGISVVKFFPAEQNGGLAKLKALAGPYTSLRWMPTGGVNENNLVDYLRFDRIVACGGTWMVKKDLIAAGNWDEIERLTAAAVQKMLGFKTEHIGINCGDDAGAKATAQLLGSLFGFASAENESSIFADGRAIELMKQPWHGTHGHIAVSTNTLPRAIAYLKGKGVAFREETITDKSAYLAQEIAGFAVHLVQR